MPPTRWVLLAAALVLAAIGAVMLGTLHLAPGEVVQAAFGSGTPTHVAVVRSLRLPRVLLAMLVGAGLGAAGAALQGATRNGLA
ncbi:MAG: ABC-type transporter, integral rane subunit, partial [Gemmatimonadetes bacterium]|nr:ABC-type transporter, integral rane subunit [Gemmatimonadota bacterium]